MSNATTVDAHQIALASAEQTLGANASRCDGDVWRPKFHFGPRSGWMNDPNGTIFHDGWYHAFYQHNPYGDNWACMHWGHARSRDLVAWEHLPIALAPSHELGEAHCYSGVAAINGEGTPVILYTSVAPHDGKFEQWAAHGSSDLTTWRKWDGNPLPIAPNPTGEFSPSSRDPFVFRADAPYVVQQGERTFCVIGEDTPEDALLTLYEAQDDSLLTWKLRGELMRRPKSEIAFLECPNLVQFGEKWLLILSPYGALRWWSGVLDLNTAHFSPEREGELEPRDFFYATNTLRAPDGRVILLGWVRHFPLGRGWNGCLSLPRVLTLDESGAPCQWPVAELETLRGELLWQASNQPLTDALLPLAPDNAAELHLHADKSVTLEVFLNDDASGEPALSLELPRGEARVFLDRSVVEAFGDEGHWVRTQILPFAEATSNVVRLRLHASNGVQVKSAAFYALSQK